MSVKSTMLSVSIVIPTFNERENIGILVGQLRETLGARGIRG
jgi:glycosyltransferase involved in cell wall biosynthesis